MRFGGFSWQSTWLSVEALSPQPLLLHERRKVEPRGGATGPQDEPGLQVQPPGQQPRPVSLLLLLSTAFYRLFNLTMRV